MGRIWTIARQTMAEGVRMKTAVVFMVFIGGLVIVQPLMLRDETTVSDAVQTFLSFSLGLLGVVLSLLAIFLSRSLSEEMVNRQILILMTKPIPRWQFVVGKWLGIVSLNTMLLVGAGVGIFVATLLLARMEPRDELDRMRLNNEVLVARHATSCIFPEFHSLAATIYEQNLEQGLYTDSVDLIPRQEKARLARELESRWRTVDPLDSRTFEFENVRCERSPEKLLQIRYKAEVWAYAPDEILRAEWFVGNPDKGTSLYHLPRRDVIGRFHSMPVPTDAIAPDRTLTVVLRNRNPFPNEVQAHNTMNFSGNDDIQVLFTVGSFGGNLIRQLTLQWCRLSFLAAFALLATCLFSFPVACLLSLTFLAMSTMAGFLTDALIYFEDDGAPGMFREVVQWVYNSIYLLIPNFAKYDGASLLVDGRNVTLRWVLTALAKLVIGGTSMLLLAACLLFQRREVAEVSV